MRNLSPIHPGEQLREEFLRPLALSAYRLARYLGTTPEFRLNLQRGHDLETAAIALGGRLQREVQPRAA